MPNRSCSQGPFVRTNRSREIRTADMWDSLGYASRLARHLPLSATPIIIAVLPRHAIKHRWRHSRCPVPAPSSGTSRRRNQVNISTRSPGLRELFVVLVALTAPPAAAQVDTEQVDVHIERAIPIAVPDDLSVRVRLTAVAPDEPSVIRWRYGGEGQGGTRRAAGPASGENRHPHYPAPGH